MPINKMNSEVKTLLGRYACNMHLINFDQA